MSTNRVSKKAGWVNRRRLPKGPNGRCLCRYCSTEVPKGRRTFCSPECVHEWRIRTDPGYVRELVLARDKGICIRCGRDARRLKRPGYARRSGWEAHHKVAVVEGGGECGLDGYETLCFECHDAETAALAARRAEARQAETGLSDKKADKLPVMIPMFVTNLE